MNDVQKKIKAFIADNNLNVDVNTRLLDLVSEVGELAKAYLKATQYDKEKFINTPNWEEELADVVFTLVVLANRANINLNQALKNVLLKYELRIEQSGTPGSQSSP